MVIDGGKSVNLSLALPGGKIISFDLFLESKHPSTLEYSLWSLSTFISVRFEQYLNASGLMLVVVLVTSILVRAWHFKKASRSIFVTFLGMLILVMPQSAKAPAPITAISASGWNLTVFMLAQPMKALDSINCTDLGILNDSRRRKPANTFLSSLSNSQSPKKLNAFSLEFVENAPFFMLLSFEPAGTLIVSRFIHM